jgi:hypothetical protein
MDLAFCTRDVAPPVRLAAWRELVNRAFMPLKITPLALACQPGGFQAPVTGRDVGGLRVWRVAGSPMAATRASRHIGSSASADYLLALHTRGAAHATQHSLIHQVGSCQRAVSEPVAAPIDSHCQRVAGM